MIKKSVEPQIKNYDSLKPIFGGKYILEELARERTDIFDEEEPMMSDKLATQLMMH